MIITSTSSDNFLSPCSHLTSRSTIAQRSTESSTHYTIINLVCQKYSLLPYTQQISASKASTNQSTETV